MNNSIAEKKNDLICYLKELGSYNEHEYGTYNQDNNEIIMCLEVAGTQYEGRTERIEQINNNDKVKIIRDKNNQYNKFNLAVQNLSGESLGNLSSEAGEIISPLLDIDYLAITDTKVSYVEPLSKRSARCKKAILYVELKMKFIEPKYTNNECCTLCYLGGDQTREWVQKLEVVKCNIPLNDAKLIFEVYNRLNEEYTNNDYSYLGLDNLVEEVKYHREKINKEKIDGLSYDKPLEPYDFYDDLNEICNKEPERYSSIKKYFAIKNDEYNEFYSLRDFLDRHAIDIKTYYWIDQCRVSEEEWERETGWGFNHWYNIVELYDIENELPFDLTDEDIVSIFGFKKFISFADLSYGC